MSRRTKWLRLLLTGMERKEDAHEGVDKVAGVGHEGKRGFQDEDWREGGKEGRREGGEGCHYSMNAQ